MADITLDTSVYLFSERLGVYGPYWISATKGAVVCADSAGPNGIYYTTDGGANWTAAGYFDGTERGLAVWFDRETPGDTGTLLHLAVIHYATPSEVQYRTFNIDTQALGTLRTVVSGTTYGSGSANKVIAVTKSVSGNLYVGWVTTDVTAQIGFYRSTDSGATWTSRAALFESTAERDWAKLYPANTGDNDDVCAIYHDISASELSVKMYDNSADSWTETSISTSITPDTVDFGAQFDGAVRHSDSHLLVGAHSTFNNAADNFKTWDLTVNSISAPTVTAKTNVFSAQGGSALAQITVDQNSDDVYAGYAYGTWQSLVAIVGHKSTDGMGNWGAQGAISETTDDLRAIGGPRSISTGFLTYAWFNDDLNDLLTNMVNAIGIGLGTTVIPGAASLAIAAQAPSAVMGSVLIPNAAALAAALLAPSPTATEHRWSTPGLATLATSLPPPQISVGQNAIPDTLTILVFPFTPTPTVTENIHVAAGVLAQVLAGYAPGLPLTLTPDLLAMALSLLAPSVVLPVLATPDLVALALSLPAPAVAVTAHVVPTPAVLAASMTGYAPGVLTPAMATPDSLNLTFATLAPVLAITENQLLTPDLLALLIAGQIPIASLGQFYTPDALALALSLLAPDITIAVNQIVTPDPLALALATYAVSVLFSHRKRGMPGGMVSQSPIMPGGFPRRIP